MDGGRILNKRLKRADLKFFSRTMTACIPTGGADSEIQGRVDELVVSQSRCHSLETRGQRRDLRQVLQIR